MTLEEMRALRARIESENVQPATATTFEDVQELLSAFLSALDMVERVAKLEAAVGQAVGDVIMLRKAIEAGDPVDELTSRCTLLLNEVLRPAMNGETPPADAQAAKDAEIARLRALVVKANVLIPGLCAALEQTP